MNTTKSGLSLSLNLPVALIFTPVTNLLLYVRIVSTTGQFTCNIKGPSNILSRSMCYRLQPLMAALSLLFDCVSFVVLFFINRDRTFGDNFPSASRVLKHIILLQVIQLIVSLSLIEQFMPLHKANLFHIPSTTVIKQL